MSMIDDKKIEKAIEDYVRYSSVEDEYPGTEGDAFKAGAEWAINEFLNDLWHDAFKEHVPRGKMVIVEYTYEGGIYYRSLKYLMMFNGLEGSIMKKD